MITKQIVATVFFFTCAAAFADFGWPGSVCVPPTEAAIDGEQVEILTSSHVIISPVGSLVEVTWCVDRHPETTTVIYRVASPTMGSELGGILWAESDMIYVTAWFVTPPGITDLTAWIVQEDSEGSTIQHNTGIGAVLGV